MAQSNGKRKRVQIADDKPHNDGPQTVKKARQTLPTDGQITVQIVTGDYERVLHGLTATLPDDLTKARGEASWAQTFLFSAHTAAIRCVAISSVAENGKRLLATGGADERINVYSIASTPSRSKPKQPTLSGTVIAENAGNRSLGSLNHHDRAITRLDFPSKGKLFSAGEDNIVAISRTRDWTMLSSIKAPIPKVQGRPSGDTATPNDVPSGINDFAIHPSQKLMLSVSRGERCMRLWNLMTGKKAGVLSFDRDLLAQVGETKYSSGEGRRVLWDSAGERYIVGFERGAAMFGIDSKPQAVIRPATPTKLHQYRTISIPAGDSTRELVAISTENGRILIFSLDELNEQDDHLPKLACIAQIGGREHGVATRLKDFCILSLSDIPAKLLVVAAGSDGTIWLWTIETTNLDTASITDELPRQIGELIGKHKTESRITCLDAFVMDSKAATSEPESVEAYSEQDNSSEEEDSS